MYGIIRTNRFFENIDVIERVHLRFLIHILNLKSSTPSFLVYGETGRFSLYKTIYAKLLDFEPR